MTAQHMFSSTSIYLVTPQHSHTLSSELEKEMRVPLLKPLPAQSSPLLLRMLMRAQCGYALVVVPCLRFSLSQCGSEASQYSSEAHRTGPAVRSLCGGTCLQPLEEKPGPVICRGGAVLLSADCAGSPVHNLRIRTETHSSVQAVSSWRGAPDWVLPPPNLLTASPLPPPPNLFTSSPLLLTSSPSS